MKIVKPIGDEFDFRYNAAIFINITKEGALVDDEVAKVIDERYGKIVTIEDAPGFDPVALEPADTAGNIPPVAEVPVLPSDPISPEIAPEAPVEVSVEETAPEAPVAPVEEVPAPEVPLTE